MKIFSFICEYYKKTEKISRIILKIYLYILLGTYTFTLILAAFREFFFPDYTTFIFHLNEILIFANRITIAFVMPVFLFEIMCIYNGVKTTL